MPNGSSTPPSPPPLPSPSSEPSQYCVRTRKDLELEIRTRQATMDRLEMRMFGDDEHPRENPGALRAMHDEILEQVEAKLADDDREKRFNDRVDARIRFNAENRGAAIRSKFWNGTTQLIIGVLVLVIGTLILVSVLNNRTETPLPVTVPTPTPALATPTPTGGNGGI